VTHDPFLWRLSPPLKLFFWLSDTLPKELKPFLWLCCFALCLERSHFLSSDFFFFLPILWYWLRFRPIYLIIFPKLSSSRGSVLNWFHPFQSLQTQTNKQTKRIFPFVLCLVFVLCFYVVFNVLHASSESPLDKPCGPWNASALRGLLCLLHWPNCTMDISTMMMLGDNCN
jgi:hypothetical protein